MKIIYQGTLSEGILLCPYTGLEFKFKKGQAIDVPEPIASSATSGPLWKVASEPTETKSSSGKQGG
jgi:hypothetical protein